MPPAPLALPASPPSPPFTVFTHSVYPPPAAAGPGVAVNVLRRMLTDAYSVAAAPSDQLTTADVCELGVKPATVHLSGDEETRTYLRLVEGEEEDGRPLVAPATHFVSHAWKYNFASVLSTLEAIDKESNGTAYFW